MARPAVFVHGLWLHATSWRPWLDLFAQRGYDPIAPGWPHEPPTAPATQPVAEAHPVVEAGERGETAERDGGNRRRGEGMANGAHGVSSGASPAGPPSGPVSGMGGAEPVATRCAGSAPRRYERSPGRAMLGAGSGGRMTPSGAPRRH